MKIKSVSLFVVLFLTTFTILFAQMPSYTGFPPPQTTAPSGAGGSAAQSSSGGSQTSPGTKAPATSTQQVEPTTPGVVSYDPYMDNHLHAPPADKPIGLFGRPIREVEKILDQYGAKNYSYAFGKYSRMRISPYLLTMYFDRQKRLGGLSVEPMAPYKVIAPAARKFFLELFLENKGMGSFETIISSNRLELRYKKPN